MAEFHIWLQYISKQHTGAENAFLLRIFDQCAAKTRIFLTRHKVNRGGGQMEFLPTARFGPNSASAAHLINIFIAQRHLSTVTVYFQATHGC